MGNLGFSEILVILFVALVVFGPDRLPELARQAGKAIARFRKETSGSIAELRKAADLDDLEREIKAISKEMKDVRSSVTRSLLAGGEPAPRADDAPPPTDPDAT